MVSFHVPGIPAPQGSKTRTRYGFREANPKTMPWRATVTAHALQARGDEPTILGAVGLKVTFFLPRPKSHYRTGGHIGIKKAKAPIYCATKPDVSKLVRAIEDSLVEAAVIRDDAQIAELHAWTLYADDAPGVDIQLRILTQP